MATIEWGTTAGKWSEEAKWVGGTKPGAGDDVVLGATSANLEVAAEGKCRSLTATAYTKTLTLEAKLKIGTGTAAPENKALTLGAAAKTAGEAGEIVFVSTTGETEKLTTAGVTISAAVTFEGVGGEWQLMDSLTVFLNLGTGTLSVVKGTFDTNGQTITCQKMTISGAEKRTVLLQESEIYVEAWDATTTTELTFTPGTSRIVMAPRAAATFFGGGLTYATVIFGSHEGAVTITVKGDNKFGSLEALHNGSTGVVLFEEGSKQTLTAANLGGNNLARAIWASVGAKFSSAATLTADWAVFKGISFEGAGTLTAQKHCTNEGENENITFETESEQADIGMSVL